MNANDARRLKELIKASAKNEKDCCDIIQRNETVVTRLCPFFPEEIIALSCEQPNMLGRADIVFSVLLPKIAGGGVRAYVWECKAPQCFLFRKETRDRLCPSTDLVAAENQLLNYTEELRQNGFFQRKFRVDCDNVVPGGIIIGSDRTMVEGSTCNDKHLYEIAYGIRSRYFYSLQDYRIRVVTWDRIVELLEEPNVTRVP